MKLIRLVYGIGYVLIRFSGLAGLFRLVFARNKVSIVLYHNPSPEIFAMHLKYLSRRYNLISLPEFSDALYFKNLKNIPKYALVITLDDGWKENFRLIPVIKQYKVRPTVFLVSHLTNTERHFWWTVCSDKELDRLKNIPNHQRLAELSDQYQYYPEKEYKGDRQALNMTEIKEMKDFFDFSLHTCFHPILPKCSKEEKRKEIVGCKTEIENLLGLGVNTFSYPNGDYDDDSIEILKECGVKVARTIDAGWNSQNSDPYKLKVTGVSDNGSLNKLVAELTGISMFFQYLFRGSFSGIKK